MLTSECFDALKQARWRHPVSKVFTAVLLKGKSEMANKEGINTPISPTETLGQHEDCFGDRVTDNVQTTRPDGSVVTREYRAFGEGPVINDTREKK